ncbi:MAG: hypothetical protein PHT80_05130 [Lentisphaeria bacterium]|nr:hypothetical protein [Lentisphaeria bacterium]
MKWLHKIIKAGLGRPLLLFLVLLLALNGWLELRGVPAARCPLLRAWLANSGLDGEFSWLRIGVVRGMVLNDLGVTVMTPAGPAVIHSDTAVLRPRLGALCRGKIVPDTVILTDARVNLLDEARRSMLFCRLDKVALRLGVDDGLLVDLLGRLHGFELHGSAQLASGRQWFEQQQVANSGAPVRRQQQLVAGIKGAAAALNRCDFGHGDARLDLRLTGDCLDTQSLSARGRFSLSDAELDEVFISKLRGTFQVTAKEVLVDRLLLFMGRDERLQGSVRLDRQSQQLSAELWGRLLPASVAQVLGRHGSELPTWLRDLPTVQFRGTLPPAPLALAAMRPEVQCHFGASSLRQLHLQRGQFMLALADHAVILRDVRLDINDLEGEWLSGEARWDYAKDLLSGTFSGQLQLLTQLRRLGLRVPEKVFSVEDRKLSLSLDLQPSPLAWRQWQLAATLTQPQPLICQREVNELTARLRLVDGRLSLDGLGMVLPDLPAEVLDATAETDLGEFLDRGTGELRFALQLQAKGANGDPWTPGMTMAGQLQYRRDKGQLHVALQSAGDIYPDRVYRSYREPLRIPPVDILALIYCTEQPVAFTLDLPPWNVGREPWRFGGTLRGENGGFDTLALSVAEGEYAVSARETTFSNLRATTSMGESLALNMRIQYAPFVFELSDIDVVGNPRVADPFIMHGYGREIYNQIWEHVLWDPAHPAHIQAPSLIYTSNSESDWRLTMSSTLTVEKVSYRDAVIPALQVAVGLDLPSQVMIRPITVTVPDGVLRAEFDIFLQGVPQCEFRILPSEGTLNPKKLLQAIDPSWGNLLADVSFSDASHLHCDGSFFLSGESRLQIGGRLQSPHCTYGVLAVEDVVADWSLTASTLHWQVKDAKYLGGSLASSGFYDTRTSRGETLLIANKMSFDRFLAQLGIDEKNTEGLPGHVNAESHVQILRGWAGRPYHLEGTGHVAIRDSELWQVPLLTKLGGLLEVTTLSWLTQRRLAGLGRISSLDADLEFVGQRLVVPTLSTNGTIIALNGSGEYNWDTDKMYFLVSGEALKEVSILSMVLKPLTWAFHAELTGTRAKNEWTLRTALRKIFSTD